MVMQPVSLYSWPTVMSQACVEAILEEDCDSRDFVRGNYESLEIFRTMPVKGSQRHYELERTSCSFLILEFLGSPPQCLAQELVELSATRLAPIPPDSCLCLAHFRLKTSFLNLCHFVKGFIQQNYGLFVCCFVERLGARLLKLWFEEWWNLC